MSFYRSLSLSLSLSLFLTTFLIKGKKVYYKKLEVFCGVNIFGELYVISYYFKAMNVSGIKF